jgi:hypothetical protein
VLEPLFDLAAIVDEIIAARVQCRSAHRAAEPPRVSSVSRGAAQAG